MQQLMYEMKFVTKTIEINSKIICEKFIEEAIKNSHSSKLKRDNMTLVVADLRKHAEIEKMQQKKQANCYFFNNE